MSPLNLEPVESVEETGQDSVLDHIRGLYQEAKSEPRLTLSVPGPIGKYVKIRYRPTDDDFSRPADTPVLDVALDCLVHCCDEILIKGEDGSWEPLLADGEPVRFDQTLNDTLGLGVPDPPEGTARQVVLAVYSWAPKPRNAVIGVFQRLGEWMAGAGDVDEERLLGEF